MRSRIRILLLLALVAACGGGAAAQQPDSAHRATGASIVGVVRDSIAHAPLPEAQVQLVGAGGSARAGRIAVADATGRFAFDSVPDGRYMLGFFHPLLDSLGVAAPVREVVVAAQLSARVDLSTPAPASLRTAICGARSRDSGAVVIGTVHDARDGSPAARVEVTAEWLEMTFTTHGAARRAPRLVANTGDNGWFALCNVPRGGTMFLQASRGADSTDRIEVLVPSEGFLRHELWLGSARTVVVGDSARRAGSAVLPPRRVHVGTGRLSGTVTAAAGGQPLAGAQVSVVDGPQAQANAQGEWVLVDAPAGTRMLEVRAVGYYPARRRVDVVAGAPPIRVALSTFKAVLDTVRVTATRYNARVASGFAERHRSGMGRYLTADDIARTGAFNTADLFKMMPGVRLDRTVDDSMSITMRSAFGGFNGGTAMCSPMIFLDRHPLPGISAAELDGLIVPTRLAGVEVYTESSVPAEFTEPLKGCGAIVLWSK